MASKWDKGVSTGADIVLGLIKTTAEKAVGKDKASRLFGTLEAKLKEQREAKLSSDLANNW